MLRKHEREPLALEPEPGELELAGETVRESSSFREVAIMVCPPCRDRGCRPALEGNRDGAAILARTSVEVTSC